ncbi:MAG: DUF309 domain-containing protein [Candidatus Bathyarchaeia archaeon]
MRYLIRLKNGIGAVPRDRRSLSYLAYDSVKGLGEDIGNLRISPSAVELDLLLDSPENLKSAIEILESKIGSSLTIRQLDTEMPQMEKGAALRLGLDLFNQERYWESHEALESVWLTAIGREKRLLQGLILAAAALVHLQKGEDDVALSILNRASEKFRNDKGSYSGIDIGKLEEIINSMLSSCKPAVFKLQCSYAL